MIKRGKLPPKKDDEKDPIFDFSLMFYWEAFWELNTTRHELGSIPWTAMNEYCKRWGIDSETEFDSFCFFIRGLDNEYLSIKHKNLEKERDLNKYKNRKR